MKAIHNVVHVRTVIIFSLELLQLVNLARLEKSVHHHQQKFLVLKIYILVMLALLEPILLTLLAQNVPLQITAQLLEDVLPVLLVNVQLVQRDFLLWELKDKLIIVNLHLVKNLRTALRRLTHAHTVLTPIVSDVSQTITLEEHKEVKMSVKNVKIKKTVTARDSEHVLRVTLNPVYSVYQTMFLLMDFVQLVEREQAA